MTSPSASIPSGSRTSSSSFDSRSVREEEVSDGDDDSRTSGSRSRTLSDDLRRSSTVARTNSRRSTLSTTPPQLAGPGSFLSRFVSSFRSSAASDRPALSRSTSSPSVRANSSSSPTSSSSSSMSSPPSQPAQLSYPYPVNQGVSISSKSAFRPSYRRAMTAAATAATYHDSDTLISVSPSYAARSSRKDEKDRCPAELRKVEEVLMVESNGGDGTRRETTASASGPILAAVPLPSSLAPLSMNLTLEPLLQHPLELVSTLLPPILALLSQLSPAHLLSPSLRPSSNRSPDSSVSAPTSFNESGSNQSRSTVPTLDSLQSESSRSTSSPPQQGRPSPTNLSSSPPLSHSHELCASSAVSVPAVSAAAIWRLLRGIEWISELGRTEQGMTPSVCEWEKDQDRVFDFPAVLQGAADILAAQAAIESIGLIIAQVGRGSSPTFASTLDPDSSHSASEQKWKGKAIEARELLVRSDERGWVVGLVWILNAIMSSAPAGSTVEARFCATVAQHPIASRFVAGDSQETAVPTRDSLQKWFTISIDFVLLAPPPNISTDQTPRLPQSSPSLIVLPDFESSVAKSLFDVLDISMSASSTADTVAGQRHAWKLTAILPASRSLLHGLDSASLLDRRRASLEGPALEPRIEELLLFVDAVLKGTKVELRAGDASIFAKYLTTYLTGWGMDVTHIALDASEPNLSAPSIHSPLSDPVRREVFGRFDSGFGASAAAMAATAAAAAAALSSAASTSDSSARPTSERSNSGSIDPISSSAETATSSDTTTSSGSLASHPRTVSIDNIPSPATSSAGGDSTAASSFIIIDDDIATLKRLLILHRTAMPLHYAPTLLKQRPQLATRRTRSSNQVRHLTPLSTVPSVIIFFTSISQIKEIREIVQEAINGSRSVALPEVFVIPKPAGPRRIITALWTALRRPLVDLSLAPIATAPSSAGGQHGIPRLSPALSSHIDLDSAAAESMSAKSEIGTPGSVSRVRTPPCYFPGLPPGHPPSPLGKISDEQVSYFSCVAETMDGTSPSEGMVVQSPNGRPAIFFQPQPRGLRTSSGTSAKREGGKMCEDVQEMPQDEEELAIGSSTPPATPPLSRSAISAPHEIGLGHGRRISSTSSSTSDLASAGTPALTLDMYITAAKTRAQSDLRSIDASGKSPTSPSSAISLHRQGSNASSTRSNLPASTASRPAITSIFSSSRSRNTSGSSTSAMLPPRTDSPVFPGTAGRGSPIAGVASPPRRFSGPSGKGRPRRNTGRRSPALLSVPPINVLIVEDNPINQKILSMFMKKKGIKFAVANNGEEAVQKWKEGNFHLVLMDIQLPVKDGIEATREIREMERENNIGTFMTTPNSDTGSGTAPSHALMSPSSPLSSPQYTGSSSSPLLVMPVIIVALTASSLQVDRVNALAAGCNDFLTKPVSLLWLQQKLLEWGSMCYLGGFSRMTAISTLIGTESSLASKSPDFRAGLVANNQTRGSDTMAGRLRLPNLPLLAPTPVVASLTPNLLVISPSPDATPIPSTPMNDDRVDVNHTRVASSSTAKSTAVPDLENVDQTLLSLIEIPKRPGLQPFSLSPPLTSDAQ